MRYARIVSFVAVVWGALSPLHAQLWTDVATDTRSAGERLIVPDSARTVALDAGELEVILAVAPSEAAVLAGATGTVVTLPYPDGTEPRFELIASPIMEPQLAEKFPEIRTFILKGIDDPSAWGRGDITPQGFHAMVWGSGGVVLVDPLVMGDATIHQSYFAKDHRRSDLLRSWTCAVGEHPSETLVPAGLKERADLKLTNGTDLREFRIAIAATGEYTTFHGGTVPLSSAAITTALNRVNAIYERELSIRLTLVAGNDAIVYTDPDTDPFTNDDPDLLLAESQTTIDAVIGAVNYDIGHTLSTASVGRAAIGVVCHDFLKAKGESGGSTPVGDIYFVDALSHEIGHQFSATHTSNSDTAGCSALRNPATAYEPGSGSTIMAIPIAGCGAENLQSTVDDYFHVSSLEQILAYVTTGYGNLCVSSSSTGNTPPTADAGLDYVIPASTPFVLTGSAADGDGDSLTYAWEQFDLGDPNPSMIDDGFGPIFRSWEPSSDPARTFPRLTDLLAGTLAVGETLPTTDRQLTYRLTVRDNRTGGGGLDTDTAVLTVTSSAGPFAVTAPNTATTWSSVGPHTVTWDVAGTAGAPVNCSNVDITLSTDGGFTYPVSVAAGTLNDGSESTYVFSPDTTSARIRVQCDDNVFFDVSDDDFVIAGSGELIFLDDLESSDVGAWSVAYP